MHSAACSAGPVVLLPLRHQTQSLRCRLAELLENIAEIPDSISEGNVCHWFPRNGDERTEVCARPSTLSAPTPSTA